ncbi:MAG: threonine--tRNA ligase [Candidatus Pacebacteria bacterium]|nr:threonine--tRNA ligase [Candidatus Paceibacterota bacterium]
MEQEKLNVIRHSLAHLLGAAVKELYPDVKIATGPAIENGFYYDFDFTGNADSNGTDAEKRGITEKDLGKIEQKMREIFKKWQSFERKTISYDEAKKLFEGNPYKLELIEEYNKDGKELSIYTSGDFTDLCAGPHIEDIKDIKTDAFKLERIAGAYWKGDEKNKMLTRIYGLAFSTKEELIAYELQQEEARKRDHRKLGKELKLFTISDLVGAGLPMLQPNGMILRKEIEDYLWDLHKNKGYDRVWTPHITKKGLYETSGHAAKFGEELFRVKGGDEEFFMKPMNCPHHMQIFSDNQFSYRDMPVRYFEPATVYRYEKAGQLSGLTRVRAITQDDGHLFCRVTQISEEVGTIVKIIKEFYTTMNMMGKYWVRLSVRGDDKSKYLGGDEVWEKAESALEKSAKENELNYKRVEGEAAFYGPKLDFMFYDAIGREWQLATIQCDFNLPERFDLSFTNEKGEKERPVVIHRAVSGALERFMGVMIEHFSGNFPLWLSPVQIKVVPVRENHNEVAKQVGDELKKNGFRVDCDMNEGNMGGKIRDAKNKRIPYTIIIGDKDIAVNKITVENRDKGQLGQMDLKDFIEKIKTEKNNKE